MVRLAAALTLSVFAALTPVSCGNFINLEIDGLVGVSHDGNGNLTAHVMTCGNSAKEILVTKENDGDVVYGRFVSPHSSEGYIEVPLSAPKPWEPSKTLSLPKNPSARLKFDAVPTRGGGPGPFIADRIFSPTRTSMAEIVDYEAGIVIVSYRSDMTRDGAVTVEDFKTFCAGWE